MVVGCSASHEVAVVSHGEESVAVKLPAEPVPQPPIKTLPDLPIEQEKLSLPAPVAPIARPAPISPSIVSPANDSFPNEIFAQSAEDTTLSWTLQDIFFDYDQTMIRQDAIPILEENAKVLLKRYANREVLIQGHCDERGTEAYNLILGERRAKAVKNYLINLGVSASKMRVLSLGKSQPFCQEQTIPCFRQNRRAHFVLK